MFMQVQFAGVAGGFFELRLLYFSSSHTMLLNQRIAYDSPTAYPLQTENGQYSTITKRKPNVVPKIVTPNNIPTRITSIPVTPGKRKLIRFFIVSVRFRATGSNPVRKVFSPTFKGCKVNLVSLQISHQPFGLLGG